MSRPTSAELFQRACRVMPGGVNSPVRAFKGVGGTPVYFERAAGPRLFDVEGREYLDYVLSWGPMILGHCHPRVQEAVKAALDRGTSFGAPTEPSVLLAERLTAALPSLQMVRLVNSGTEATMSALRLARGFTGRDKVVKFNGCYHGHTDSLLVKAGSGAATFGIPDSAGVTAALAADTLTVEYNDLEGFEALMTREGPRVACVIVEPVAGNMGVVPPAAGFLAGLRDLTRRYGSLLILDEVMTGFRVAWGGAQLRYEIEPDLTCLGKVIGGGFPVGAYGGRKDLMGRVAPDGPVYQAGTLSGNPIAVAAGLATLDEMSRPGTYERLEALSARLAVGLEVRAREMGVPARVQRVGSMLTLFFCAELVRDLQTAKASDCALFGRYFHAMLERGVYLPPSQFESWFLGTAHTEADIDRTLAAHAGALEAAVSKRA